MSHALRSIAWIATLGLAVSGAAAVANAAPPAGDLELLHLRLEKSAPEADQTLDASPSAVTLWFSQAPQISGTSIRVVPEGGDPLELGDAAASADDAKVIVLAVPEPLANGAYRIYWRAMASDGHVVRGDYAFAVQVEGR